MSGQLSNRPVYLRFFAEEGEVPKVSVRELGAMSELICDVVRAMLAPALTGRDSINLLFLSPPRSACLEFLFEPVVHFNVQAFLNFETIAQDAVDLRNFLNDSRDWAMLFFTVAFGGTGVLNLLKKHQSVEEALTRLERIESNLAHWAASEERVLQALERLEQAARSSPYLKIEIQIGTSDTTILKDLDSK
jgi:hypothetical protein